MLSLGQVPTSSVWGWNSSRILSAVLHTPSWLAKKNYLGKGELLAYNSDPRKYSGIKTIANPSETQSLLWLIKTKQNNLKTKAQQTNRKQPGHQALDLVSQEQSSACCHGDVGTAIQGLWEQRLAAGSHAQGAVVPNTGFFSQMLARKVRGLGRCLFASILCVVLTEKCILGLSILSITVIEDLSIFIAFSCSEF